MANINQIVCQATVKNTGICDCSFDPKNIVGFILVLKDKYFTETELADATIASTMSTAILAGKATRIYPVTGFVGFTDSSEDPVKQTFGFGAQETVREGKYIWTHDFRRGGVHLNNALRSFNGLHTKYNVMFIDASNVLIGTTKVVSGAIAVAGIPLDEIYTKPWKANDGSNTTNYSVALTFDAVYINENIAFKKVETTALLLKELTGLLDVNLSQSAVASTTVTVKLVTACGEDLYDLYADDIADVTAFTVANKTTGAAITVTGVTKNATLKAWVIALDSDDTDLPASSGKYIVTAATPSGLNTLGVSGYEVSNTLEVTRP